MFWKEISNRRRAVLLGIALSITVIALTDWRAAKEIPLGFLYLLPMLLAGTILKRWQIAGVAAVCTLLTEYFDSFTWRPVTGLPRDILYFAAFFFVGLCVYEMNRSRQTERQLSILIETSPAAVITADADGKVLMANEAAHRLLGIPVGELPDRIIYRYLPSLTNVMTHGAVRQHFRAVMQARGRREDGEDFLADICFSTYRTQVGLRLAALVLDASEDFRLREESGLRQLLTGSKIAVSAVSHEIRNVCGAIGVVHQNLQRRGSLAESKDFEVLGNLARALERIAGVNLQQTANQVEKVDLVALLEELRIVITPSLREEGIDGVWNVDEQCATVWADKSSLMQVFLNLTTNSIRALSQQTERSLTITTRRSADRVLVEFADTGGGVSHPENLFQLFQQGAEATGIGLYLSRALARSFGGELVHKPLAGGALFIVELPSAARTRQD
jgi:PAS domain S-box-containing protein